jgi:hypothetical protein
MEATEDMLDAKVLVERGTKLPDAIQRFVHLVNRGHASATWNRGYGLLRVWMPRGSGIDNPSDECLEAFSLASTQGQGRVPEVGESLRGSGSVTLFPVTDVIHIANPKRVCAEVWTRAFGATP